MPSQSKEYPILMKGEMVRALLAGTKTQTRRTNLKTKYAVGDRLWVRETWSTTQHTPGWDGVHDDDSHDGIATLAYRADGGFKTFRDLDDKGDDEARRGLGEWKPSLFMPRWGSRIILEITALREERLNAISQEDAISEGIGEVKDNSGFGNHGLWRDYSKDGSMPFDSAFPVHSYATLWESINGPGSWDENPVVRVISFKVVKP